MHVNMKKLFSELKVDLKRAFFSYRFLLAIVLVVLLSYISIIQEYVSYPGGNIVYYFEIFVLGGSFTLITLIIAVIPYGPSFCVDQKSQFIRLVQIRTTVGAYTWAKVIAVALSTFVAIIVGYIITLFLFSLHLPLVGSDYLEYGYQIINDTVIGSLLEIHPLLYLSVRICIIGASCMFWATFALLISAYFPNAFVVYVSPIITYYVFINSIGKLLPSFLKLNLLFTGIANIGVPLVSFIYILGLFLVLSIISGMLFSKKVKRRLANE